MDEKNRQILGLLQQNARLSIKTIAGKVGLARSSVRDRIARMEASGVIRAYRVELASRDPLAPQVEAFLMIRARQDACDAHDRKYHRPSGGRALLIGRWRLDVIVEARTSDVDSLNRLRDEIACYPHVVDLTTRIILKRDKDA